VEGCDLLVEVLGENVHLLLVLARLPLVPQLKLSNDLRDWKLMLTTIALNCTQS
jgi:hypothetical protein